MLSSISYIFIAFFYYGKYNIQRIPYLPGKFTRTFVTQLAIVFCYVVQLLIQLVAKITSITQEDPMQPFQYKDTALDVFAHNAAPGKLGR